MSTIFAMLRNHDRLRRVSRISRGELAKELSGVLAEVNTGLPLGESLSRCARDIQLPAFTRCVDQITGALERGSPLAEVLRAWLVSVMASVHGGVPVQRRRSQAE